MKICQGRQGPILVDRPSAVERLLREAAPHEVFDVVRSVIEQRHGAEAVDLLMADYAMTQLQPVGVLPHTHHALPVHDTAPGSRFHRPGSALCARRRVLHRNGLSAGQCP